MVLVYYQSKQYGLRQKAKEKKMKITYSPKFNFHSSPAIKLVISGDVDAEGRYLISNTQAMRIQSHFCGIAGCSCNGGQARQLDQNGKLWSISASDCA
jgi:hypothetical protein